MQFRVSPKTLTECSDEQWQARVDLAAAHRLAYMHGFSEGIFKNHLTFVVPGSSDCYYQIPFGTHWSEVIRQRLDWRGRLGDALRGDWRRRRLQPEPVEVVAGERQEVGQLADPRELGRPEHFDRGHPLELRQVQLDRLDGARQVGDAEDRFLLVAADVGEDFRLADGMNSERAAAEHLDLLAQRDRRFIQLSSENGERSCASTLIDW